MQIKNWKKFQHFKDRKPPWIKLYRDLLDDDEWFTLSPVCSKVLIMLWLLASENVGVLPSMKKIAFRLRMTEKALESSVSELSHWLIQDDIAVISEQYQLGPSETETETEEERETDIYRMRDFEQFYRMYPDTCPRKVRKTAERAWRKGTMPPIQVILASLEIQKQSKQWLDDGGQFIPAPSRWINEERWNTKMPKKSMTTTEAFLARGASHGSTRILQGLATPDLSAVGQIVPRTGQ